MTLRTLLLILYGALAGASISGASETCGDPLSVRTALRRARVLDGKIICIKGLVYPVAAPKSAGRALFVNELFPTGVRVSMREKGLAIGLVEGSADAGPGHTQYVSDSFKKIDAQWEENARTQPVIAVVLRGVIMRDKGLAKKVAAQLPSDDPYYNPLRMASHRVELVILEVVSAKKADRH